MFHQNRKRFLIFIAFFICALILPESRSYASSDPSTDLTSLNFYPHRGTFYLVPQVGAGWGSTQSSQSGVEKSSANTSSLNSTLSLNYGLWRGLRLSISESYQFSSKNDSTNATTHVESIAYSGGFSDPTFGAHYRYFENDNAGWSGDLHFTVSPATIIAKQAISGVQDGNNGRGYGTLTLSTNLYFIRSWNDAGFAYTLQRLFGGGVQGTTPANTSTRAAVWNMNFSLTDRVHFTDNFYSQLALNFNIPYTFDSTNQATPAVTTTQNYPFYFVPSILLGYRLLDNLLFELQYAYTHYTRNAINDTSLVDTGVVTTSNTVTTFLRWAF